MELAGLNQLFPEQAAFALPAMETGDRSLGSSNTIPGFIPPVLLKSIAWIESGWAQGAYEPFVNYGEVGPVLTSHDCGYGIMQVTSGMQNLTGVPNVDQAMVGGHYAFNIARGAHILADKWNQAPEFRPTVGNRDPAITENWYFALWGYNGWAFKNHPLNPVYDPNRPPFSCGPEGDGMGHNASAYPYQEVVMGCAAHPPVKGGVQLWSPIEVNLPNRNDPLWSGPLAIGNWEPCALSLACGGMDIPAPNTHWDPAVSLLPREAVFGSPTLNVSPGSVALDATPGGESLSSDLSVINAGTGVLAWRATTSASWLKLDRVQGVSLGTDLGTKTQILQAHASAYGLSPGTYTADVVVESLFAWGAPVRIPVILTVSLQAGATSAGDFTGDGKTDVAFLCCADYLSMWISQGNGSFGKSVFRAWPGYGMTSGSWQLGYFNADNKVDLIHMCCSDYANLWLSNGDGTFTLRQVQPWANYGMQQGQWQTGDFNGDFKTDLLHLCCENEGVLWLADGNGGFSISGFQPWAGYGMRYGSWQVGDVSGDGKADLVHLCCSNYANVWLSNGDGGFSGVQFMPGSDYAMKAGRWLTGDFTGDGRVDLMHQWSEHDTNVWLSYGDGRFAVTPYRPWQGYGIDTGSWIGGDFKADGRTDLIHLCCGDYANMWLSHGDGGFAVDPFQPWGGYGINLGAWQPGDFNGDGATDLLHLCCHNALLWESNGQGRFAVRPVNP